MELLKRQRHGRYSAEHIIVCMGHNRIFLHSFKAMAWTHFLLIRIPAVFHAPKKKSLNAPGAGGKRHLV